MGNVAISICRYFDIAPSRQVKSATIDDDATLDLNSDHVAFTISLFKTHLKRNKVKDKVKWKLSHNTDWDSF